MLCLQADGFCVDTQTKQRTFYMRLVWVSGYARLPSFDSLPGKQKKGKEKK
jgi:hypothetical protein